MKCNDPGASTNTRKPHSSVQALGAEPLTRDRLIGLLTQELRAEPDILAAWLGGSDANRRADEWSDVDLCVCCPDGRAEQAFEAVERALNGAGPIAGRFRVPSPTWHGLEQAFYRLQNAPDWLMIDLVVFERSKEHSFFERQRHGEPVVLFDPEGFVRMVDVDASAIARRVEQRIAELRARFDMFQNLVHKEVRRGRWADAANFYHGLTLRPLVELLRIRHAPDRWDFGLRYIDSDLPAAEARAVHRLAYPTPETIGALAAEAAKLFHETLAEIDARAKA